MFAASKDNAIEKCVHLLSSIVSPCSVFLSYCIQFEVFHTELTQGHEFDSRDELIKMCMSIAK